MKRDACGLLTRLKALLTKFLSSLLNFETWTSILFCVLQSRYKNRMPPQVVSKRIEAGARVYIKTKRWKTKGI